MMKFETAEMHTQKGLMGEQLASKLATKEVTEVVANKPVDLSIDVEAANNPTGVEGHLQKWRATAE